MTDTTVKSLVFISMLGEKEHFDPDHFSDLCSSGLEKDWVVNWFGPIAQETGFALSGVDICRGDALPAVENVDCVILGGTMHVVTEDRPWLLELFAWLRQYRETEKPLLGICGGHQLVSTQFEDGGLKGRAAGTLAGTYEIELTELGRKHPLFDGLSANPRFNFANYLHVVPSKVQKGRVLARIGESNAICIDHGNHWYTTQFHPESRRSVWSCMYEHSKPEHVENYSDDQDGVALINNFMKIAALGLV
jgi:GMP synthase (glutamine-hydrolysing)